MKKKCKIIIVLVFLFQIGIEKVYATSIRRISWGEMMYNYHFSAYHLGVFSEYETDSTAVFDIIKSSKKGLNKLIIKHKWFHTLEKNVFYIFMTSDSTDFVFGWDTEDKDEANEIFNKVKEFERIERLTNVDRKIKQYKKWLFSLCENKYQILKREGFLEWKYGRKGIVLQYAQIYDLLEDDDFVTQEKGWHIIFTERDCRRFLNILLNTNYPSFQEWELLNTFRTEYSSEIKSYIYSFFKRYSENFNENYDDIQTRKIQDGLAFVILNHIETNEKILEIIAEYNKDDNKYYPFQERKILELYINPIIEQIDKVLKCK